MHRILMLWFIVYVSSAHEDSQHIFVEILKGCFIDSVTEVILKNMGKKKQNMIKPEMCAYIIVA